MNADIAKAFADELTKIALIERLVRLGATDIPKTPRMFMRQRSPAELGQLQGSVTAAMDKTIKKPIMDVAERGISQLPDRTRPMARTVANAFASDPVGATLSTAVPIPGATALYLGGKKALESGIDKAFPLRK